MGRPILRNYFILAATSLGVWASSLAHRALLVRLAGGQALGLYQMVFPAYRLLATVVTAGLPVALTTMTAGFAAQGQIGRARHARNVAAAVTLVLAAIASALLWAGRGFLASRFFPDPRVASSLVYMPIALVFSSEAAILQGFFHGLNNMKPFAVSQVVEQVTRLVTAVMLVPGYSLPENRAAAAMASSAAAEVAGFLALLLFPAPGLPGSVRPRDGLLPSLGSMLALSFPLMLSGFMSSALQMVNVVVVPRRLFECGYSVAQSTQAVGTLFGMVMPLVLFPMVLVSPLAGALLPVIAAASGKPDKKPQLIQRLKKAYSFALMVGMLTIASLYAVGPRLGTLMYGLTLRGDLLRIAALSAPFAFAGIISISVLTGFKKNYVALGVSFVDACMQTFLLYGLTSRHFGAIAGTARALVVGWAFFALVSGGAVWMILRGGTGRNAWGRTQVGRFGGSRSLVQAGTASVS